MAGLSRKWGAVVGVAAFSGYCLLVPKVYSLPRPSSSPDMQVAIPRFAQVFMAAGDRYLAANVAGFRALVASTENMGADNFPILAKVQADVSWFNPAHEDNYYIAAAILPWYSEVDAAQYILRRASLARPFDWQPAFYHGFNAFHFRRDVLSGAEWMRIAARSTSDQMMQIQLQQIAAVWVTKGEDRRLAIQMQRSMAKETRHKAFANFLEKRAVRLENILLLEEALMRFHGRLGNYPANLSQLIGSGDLAGLPVDPFGATYRLSDNGKIAVVNR